MNRDVKELYKLYEQTVSIGNTQLQPSQPSVTAGGIPLQQPSPYNIKTPEISRAYGPAGVTAPQDLDYEEAKKDWRSFQRDNFLLSLLIQVLDPTTITSWPDIEDAWTSYVNEKRSGYIPLKLGWFIFNVFAAIPLWVPVAGQIAKVFQFLKGGKVATQVAAKAVTPKMAIAAIDTAVTATKTPAFKKFITGVLTKLGASSDQISTVIKNIDSADGLTMAKNIAEQVGIKGDDFTKAAKEFADESKETTRLASRDAINNSIDIALKLGADPLFINTTKDGLIAKIKYWLGTTGKGSTVEDAIEYLKRGDYSDLPENIKPALNEILKKYGIKENQLGDFSKLIWGEVTPGAVSKAAEKIGTEVASTATTKGVAAGAREIDEIAMQYDEVIDLLNKSETGASLPKNIVDDVKRIKKKGGYELSSALSKINARNTAEALTKIGSKSYVITKAEKAALERAAKELGKRNILKTVGQVVKGTARVAAVKVLIGAKVAAILGNWLKQQYHKGRTYQPQQPKQVKVTGLPGSYIPQGATAANPLGRQAPNSMNAISTTNQYQYKPVKWWSTQ